MYNVLDVSRYIINYSNRKDYGISNLKLQKVLYFVQAYFLLQTSNPKACFKEKIEAWDFGPVVPVAYHEYKQYSSTDIPSIETYIDFNEEDIWESSLKKFDEDCISKEDKKLIEKVVDKLSNFSATDLLQITHNQAPWKNSYIENKKREITNDEIKRYFKKKEMIL